MAMDPCGLELVAEIEVLKKTAVPLQVGKHCSKRGAKPTIAQQAAADQKAVYE